MISYLLPKDGPVAPGFESLETVYAKDQPEYIPLRTLASHDAVRRVVSRWSPTLEQRQEIADGKDVFLTLLTFSGPLQPIQMFIGDDSDSAEIAADVLCLEQVIHGEDASL